MLTKTQIGKIRKSLANGTGVDLRISKTEIRKVAKHGGNPFSSLATLGAKVLPYAVKGLSKAVPALATGTGRKNGFTYIANLRQIYRKCHICSYLLKFAAERKIKFATVLQSWQWW